MRKYYYDIHADTETMGYDGPVGAGFVLIRFLRRVSSEPFLYAYGARKKTVTTPAAITSRLITIDRCTWIQLVFDDIFKKKLFVFFLVLCVLCRFSTTSIKLQLSYAGENGRLFFHPRVQ